MLNVPRLLCVIALPLLMSGCQSSLQSIQPVAVTCLPLPAPSAWFMQPVEPNLTQRMRNELSPSPTTGITPELCCGPARRKPGEFPGMIEGAKNFKIERYAVQLRL